MNPGMTRKADEEHSTVITGLVPVIQSGGAAGAAAQPHPPKWMPGTSPGMARKADEEHSTVITGLVPVIQSGGDGRRGAPDR